MIMGAKSKGPKIPSAVAVDMTYSAATGSAIVVPTSAIVDIRADSFSLHWEAALDDWQVTDNTRPLNIYQNVNNSIRVFISPSDGAIGIIGEVGGVDIINARTTAGLYSAISNGEYAKIDLVCQRESAAADGSLTVYINSVLFETIAIPAAATVSISNTGDLVFNSTDITSAGRMACTWGRAILYNYALTAAQVLDLYKNGPDSADTGGTQVDVYKSDFSATTDGWSGNNTTLLADQDAIDGVDDCLKVTVASTGTARRINKTLGTTINVGERVEITGRVYFNATLSLDSFTITDSAAATFLDVNTHLTNQAKATWIDFKFTGIATRAVTALRLYLGTTAPSTSSTVTVGHYLYLKDIRVRRIGILLDLNGEGIAQGEGLTILDSSGNGNTATMPASGATKVTVRA